MQINVIKPTFDNGVCKKRVCAYARVSTEADEQGNSLENQTTYFEELIKANPEYEFAGIYADFGVSGYKEERPQFQKMLHDARAGKFDLIFTKSISRFGRNTVVVLNAIRELKERNIGIFFELQNINTLTSTGELMLTVKAAFAQAESECYSETAKMVYRRAYPKGQAVSCQIHRSYGYEKNENGELTQVKTEASIIREIYKRAAKGVTPANIKKWLNKEGIKSEQGSEWCDSSVTRLIENVIYKGDTILQKYYVNTDRRLVKNRGELDKFYIKDNHKAIVSRILWDAANKRIKEKRDYLANGSVVGPSNEETYPYKYHIFCGNCGAPLYRRVYSNGNRVNWGCSTKKRLHSKSPCDGINVPDSIVRNWAPNEDTYIFRDLDIFGQAHFIFKTKRAWKRDQNRKEDRNGKNSNTYTS